MKNVITHGRKSKTIVYNAARMVVDGGILGVLLLVDWKTAGFSAQSAVWIAFGLSMVDKLANIYLRSVTTKPLEHK